MLRCPRALIVASGIQSFVPPLGRRRLDDDDDEEDDEGDAHRSNRRALYNDVKTNSGVRAGVIDGWVNNNVRPRSGDLRNPE